jgi:hypothetical protein
MPSLTRDQIEQASDAKIIRVPAWGGEVCVRLMTVGDRDSYEVKLLEAQSKSVPVIPDFRSELLARCLCDDKGTLLFPGDEGVAALKRKSVDQIHGLWKAALKHNALTEEEIQKLAGE